jgi:hypothetical protein
MSFRRWRIPKRRRKMFSRSGGRTHVLFGLTLLLCTVMAADLHALSNELQTGSGLPGRDSIDKRKPNTVFEVHILQGDTSYDTASQGNYYPSLAYDSQNNQFFMVYKKVRPGSHSDIFGRFLTPDGTPSGFEFPVSFNGHPTDSQAVAAYDPASRRFLVAWGDSRYPGLNIYGQLVNADGTLSGDNFMISDEIHSQLRPSIAYDSVNQRFLVVWEDRRNGDTYGAVNYDIYGQLVNADGTLFETASDVNFVISNATNFQIDPCVAYDSVNQRFLVVWEDRRNGDNYDIYGQFVNADGTLFETASDVNFAISAAANHQIRPSVAYDSINQRFLVAWDGYNNIIYGQLVNADGTLFGTASGVKFVISNATGSRWGTSAAHDPVNQRFLVAWHDERNGRSGDLYGQFVSFDGTLLKTQSNVNFVIQASPNVDYYPSVAFNPTCRNFLVAYQTDTELWGDVGTVFAGGLCRGTPPDPFVFVDQTGVALNTLIESNAIRVSGIDEAMLICIINGEYDINDSGTWTSDCGTVNEGDMVRVRQASSREFSTTTDVTLTIGGVPDTFSVTTLAGDATPDPFTFVDQTDVLRSEWIVSNAVTISGINTRSPISIAGGEYSINSGKWTSRERIVYNEGQSVRVRVMSSSAWSATTSATLTIGGVSDTFSVITMARPQYVVTGFVLDGQGTIGCDSPVLYGNSSSCTIIAATGYHLQSLTDNSADVTGLVVGSTYTISNVTSTHTVLATFVHYPEAGELLSSMMGGGKAHFGVTYHDGLGEAHIKVAKFKMVRRPSGPEVVLTYDRQRDRMRLEEDGTETGKECSPGERKTLKGKHLTLYCSKTNVVAAKNSLKVQWLVKEKKKFAGTKDLYLFVQDVLAATDGWDWAGTWVTE